MIFPFTPFTIHHAPYELMITTTITMLNASFLQQTELYEQAAYSMDLSPRGGT
jgi:hypothetical protein